MSGSSEKKGRCMCGAVHFVAKKASDRVGACHCGMCRRWTGGPLLAVDCGDDVTFDGKDNISVYDSSSWAERGFCKKCGSHLYYRLKQHNQYIIPVGALDNPGAMVFDHQIFIEEKPEYYTFSNETRNMTGEQVFAQYSG